MIPLQVKLSFTSQNFNHRQSASVLFRQYESRKQSPVTHVVVTHNPRRSHQFDGRSISPSKILTTSHVYPKIIQSTELKTRIPTQGQSIPIQEALKIYSAKTNTDSQYNSNKVSSYIQEKINEKSNYTKTTTGKVRMTKSLPSKNLQQFIKNNFLTKIYKSCNYRKNSNKLKNQMQLRQLCILEKYQNIEKEYDKLLQENQKLKLQIQLQQVQITQLTHQQSLISPGRPSEYVSALSEQDKLKIKTLLECE